MLHPNFVFKNICTLLQGKKYVILLYPPEFFCFLKKESKAIANKIIKHFGMHSRALLYTTGIFLIVQVLSSFKFHMNRYLKWSYKKIFNVRLH